MVPDKPKNKQPWGGLGFLILVIISVLVGYFILLPVGHQVASVFQTLSNALSGH